MHPLAERCARTNILLAREIDAEFRRLEQTISSEQHYAAVIADTMIGCGLATGHGDSVDALLREMHAQVQDMQDRMKIWKMGLEIIAGQRPAIDNLMGNQDVAIWALDYKKDGGKTKLSDFKFSDFEEQASRTK